jgi:hypothetical protein
VALFSANQKVFFTLRNMEKQQFKTSAWIQISFINLCVVALAGITMRFKINFALPWVNQKHLLYAHSNFAFTGWVTIALMVLMINYLLRHNLSTSYKKYVVILIITCLAAYGMFVSFIVQGYGYFSISFSILSIIISYFFIVCFWRDLNKVNDKSYASKWFKAALVLMAIANLGEITLAYLMVNFSTVQDYYFAALYFFLHFQYNGWFLFVCFGLMFSYLYQKEFLHSVAINKHLFVIMAITVGPTYLLSILWLKLPRSLHLLANISGILQLLVLFYFIRLFPAVKKNIPRKITKTTRYLWTMAAAAFILKIVLQTFSIIPFFSNYAFGFRPIVIGYLHLSFLMIISFFIIGYINQVLSEVKRQISKIGILIFVAGVLVQEITLMLQGMEAINFEPVPYANMILFYSAIAMGTGLIWIALTVHKERKTELLNS